MVSSTEYRICKPYRLNTLGVMLFGRPFFPENQDLCPREWHKEQFEGKTADWHTDTSFEHHQTQVEDFLRFVYPRLNTLRLSFNWAFLLGAFLFGIVPGFAGLLIIFLYGDKSRIAFKEMCKRAYDLEMEARQREVPPAGREVDIVAHHLVCSYFQAFQKLSWRLMDPVTWFVQFMQLQDVRKYCNKNSGVFMEEYELWNNHTDIAPTAIEKAVENLSHPRAGGSTRYIFLFVTFFILLVTSVLLSIFLDNDPPEQPETSLTVGGSVIAAFLALSFLYLWSWIPVARRVSGLVRPSTERWEAGAISRDPIRAVSDLAMLSILVTELETERTYVPSMMCWHHVCPVLSDEASKSVRGSMRSAQSLSVSMVSLPNVCFFCLS